MGYKAAAFVGFRWSTLLQISIRSITFIKFLFIARVLSPSELGVFSIAMIVLGFFEVISETGTTLFLIREKSEKYLSEVWVISIARGFLIAALIALFSIPIIQFFSHELPITLLFLTLLVPMIKGFSNPSLIKFQKNLDFRKDFLYRVVIMSIDFVITLALLFMLKDEYALMYALILTTAVEVLLSLVFITPRPTLHLSKSNFTTIFHFGKWITSISVINYLASEVDSIVISKLLGVQNLGYYQFAQRFSLQPLTEAGDVFAKVTFPIFSKIHTDMNRSKKALINTLIGMIALLGSVTLFLLFLSEPLLAMLFDAQWLAAAGALKWLALTGLVTALMSVVTGMFLAHNKQSITFSLVLIRLIIITLLIIPATQHFGIVGASIVSLISYIATVPIAIKGVRSTLSTSNKI